MAVKGKCVMMQGTASTVGKSLLTAAYLRILKQDGYRVAPFKSQNMALNSFVTADGGEMGRAQVMQAEAAGIKPEVCMNPILLKPTDDTQAQVILNGKALGNYSAMEYHKLKDSLRRDVMAAYENLEARYDYIVLEGAGSPAEINLSENDLVNMGMAEIADAPVILIGDIDKGGVFASLYGTVMLLPPEERRRIKAVIINKFRGDAELLKPGLTMLEDRIGIPVLGVIPWLNIDLEDEDSVTERFNRNTSAGAEVRVGIVNFPYISNFTDFNNLYREHDVGVAFVTGPEELEDKDLIILPGSKNTLYDLAYLKKTGLDKAVIRAAERGTVVMGICGGYQMLGTRISDPWHTETEAGEAEGLGLLNMEVVLQKEKVTVQSRGKVCCKTGVFAALNGCGLEGYEIHMGENIFGSGVSVAGRITRRGGADTDIVDMVCSGSVFGTYLHGVFDNGYFLRALVNLLRERKGLIKITEAPLSFADFKEQEYERLAEFVRHNTDMDLFYQILHSGY